MDDFLLAVVLFGIASFIVAFIFDRGFGGACSVCVIVFGICFVIWALLRLADEQLILRNEFFGRAVVAGWIYLAIAVICAVVLYYKRTREIILWEEEKEKLAKKEKVEMRNGLPHVYCAKYGHEDNGSCVCPVCQAVVYPERHQVPSGSCSCSICRTVVYSEKHRKRSDSCECDVCGRGVFHQWDDEEEYTESARGGKLVTRYTCRICGETKMTSDWFPI